MAQAGIGAAAGGILGGISQGYSNVKGGKNFWTGKAPSKSVSSVTESMSLNPGESLDDYAAKMADAPENMPKLEKGDHVWRVYGDASKYDGQSWTNTNPQTITNYRNGAGLPKINTGEFLIEAEVIDPSGCVGSRYALPLDGNGGGLPEYLIQNPFGTWNDYNNGPYLKPIGISLFGK